jgi:hypothetical protein
MAAGIISRSESGCGSWVSDTLGDPTRFATDGNWPPASAVAVYQAALAADWKEVLSAGEQGVVIMVGVDRRQARILRRYCNGLLANPLLAAEIVRDTDETVEFRNAQRSRSYQTTRN